MSPFPGPQMACFGHINSYFADLENLRKEAHMRDHGCWPNQGMVNLCKTPNLICCAVLCHCYTSEHRDIIISKTWELECSGLVYFDRAKWRYRLLSFKHSFFKDLLPFSNKGMLRQHLLLRPSAMAAEYLPWQRPLIHAASLHLGLGVAVSVVVWLTSENSGQISWRNSVNCISWFVSCKINQYP